VKGYSGRMYISSTTSDNHGDILVTNSSFLLQLCHLLVKLVIRITVTMVITIPATVLVIVPDQHSQSTACTTNTRTESLGMFFIQI
jgi:hypothetical protein